MQKRLTTVTLAVIAVTAAQAKIGQTSEQVIQDAKREKAVSVQWVESLGRNMLRVQYHDDVILHLFGSDGREIAFYYYATKGLKPEDVDNIQRMYHTTWRGMGNDGGVFNWESVTNLHMTAERVEGHDYLAIFDMSRVDELPEIRRANPAPPPPAVVGTPIPTTPAPGIDKPAVAATSDEKDCLLVATEAYARMQKTADWAKIAGFIWLQNNKKIGGHAVVFYQPTQNSNVWMYDKSGSYEIHTKSHDLNEIVAVLNQTLRTVNIKIESPRSLEDNDSKNEFASTQSNQQPTWSAIVDGAKTQSATEPALVWRIIGGVIVAGVGVFLLGITCIAISIVTLLLMRCGWIWKREPSSGLTARKTDEEEVLKRHPIGDDAVERALERVRRKNPIT
jgi:hypothetical protein